MIVLLATIGLIVGLWSAYGYGVGVTAILVTTYIVVANHTARRRLDQERARRAYVAERNWHAGDRRMTTKEKRNA